jgi:hypothetical protein
MGRKAIIGVVVLCLISLQARAVIEFKDGEPHYLDYPVSEDVWIDYQTPGKQTTLNIVDGGDIGGERWCKAYEDSFLNISGGEIYYLYGYGDSQITVSGGKIKRVLHAFDNSQVLFYNGISTSGVTAWDYSHVTVSGGSISQDLAGMENGQVSLLGGTVGDNLSFWNNSQLNMSGGQVSGKLEAYGDSTVVVSGGNISGNIVVGYYDSDYAAVTFEGTDFHINGSPVDYGIYTRSDYAAGILTGNLANGGSLSNNFSIVTDNASIILAIPEPNTLGLIFLGILFIKKRR